jgi:hypothetical protein
VGAPGTKEVAVAETRDVLALMEAAERVAGGGDFATAASLLRQAADVQEAALGPTHPDLANTLNNLGVVCERIEQPVEAERCYRRAYAIASAVLPPEHPFVGMSAKNLRDFCDARGLPFDEAPVAPPSAASAPPALRAVPVAAVPPSTGSTRQRALAVLVVLVVAALTVVILRTRGSSPTDRPDAQATTPPAGGSVTAAAPAAEHGQASEAAPPAPAPQPSAPKAPPSSTAARSDSAPASAAASTPKPTAGDEADGIRVVEARVCGSLQTGAQWRCTPPDGPASSGTVYFYTRLSASSPTNVEHRWFQGSRLHQTIPLRVPSVSSYRLYSQLRVTPARAGQWRVEVRSSSGAVLQEARFTIAR